MKTAKKTLWMLTLIAALLTGMVFQARAEEGTPDKSVTLVMKNGAKASDYDRTESFGVMTALAVAGKLKAGEAPEGFEELEFYYDETGEAILFMYDSTSDSFGFGPAALDPEGGTKVIRAEITEEVRDGLRNFLTEMGDKLNAEQKQVVQDVIDGWKEAAISFAPLRHIQAETSGDGGLTVRWNGTNMTDEDFPDWYYSSYVGSYRLQAVPGEGSRFVKWVCNGTDYSTEPVITVELKDEHIELQAVFAMLPYYEASVTLWNGARREYLPSAELQGILLVLNAAGKLQEGKAPAQMPDAKGAFFYNEESQFLFGYFEEYERFIYGPGAIDVEGIARVVAAEITEDIRERLGYYLEAAKETEEAEYLDTIRDVIDNWTRAELVFAPPHRLTAEVQSGYGSIALAEEGESLEKKDGATQVDTTFVGNYQLEARPEDGWQFVKWIKNGEDFSEEPQIAVELDEENIQLEAVFSLIPNYEAVITFKNGIRSTAFYASDVLGVVTVLGTAGKIQIGDAPEEAGEVRESLQFYYNEKGELLFLYDSENDCFYYGPAALAEREEPLVLRTEITEEVRDKLRTILKELEDFDEEYPSVLREVIASWTAAELRFAPAHTLTVKTEGDGKFTYALEDEILSYAGEDLFQSFATGYMGAYQLGAAAAEGSRFVKWTKDGKDYSALSEILVNLDEEDLELVAVFERIPEPAQETVPPTEPAPETAAPTEAPAAPAEPASPPMGDESSLLLWMGLLLISALLSTALVVRKK